MAFENFTANTSVSQKWSSSTMDLVNIVGNILFKFFIQAKISQPYHEMTCLNLEILWLSYQPS
ncbi:hypothetical protein QM027_11735 [Campylobacter concisus]